ncbi:unnamed protein product [Oikopleura dioica]|uniref:Uncharacterized protein n=1 Tax=Oikopleura dioica TaxID=34765 RepID=E4YXK0_OIKDI|nr:unnamed protein product [Oikopleura dioica]
MMEKNYEAREWSVRHIPVRVKGRSPRPFRIPKLWVSIMLGVCLYLAVHLNSHSPQQQNHLFLRRTERDLPSIDYMQSERVYPFYFQSGWNFDDNGNVVEMERVISP